MDTFNPRLAMCALILMVEMPILNIKSSLKKAGWPIYFVARLLR